MGMATLETLAITGRAAVIRNETHYSDFTTINGFLVVV
jgi:hypothetical protein